MEYAPRSNPEHFRAMRPLRQGRLFCCLLVLSDTSHVVWHVVWQQFAFQYKQSVRMYNTHTCHKFLKSLNVKLKDFHFQPELLEVPGKGKPYFQNLVGLGTLVPKDYQSCWGKLISDVPQAGTKNIHIQHQKTHSLWELKSIKSLTVVLWGSSKGAQLNLWRILFSFLCQV